MLLDEKVALWRNPRSKLDAYYTVAANSAQASQPNVYKLNLMMVQFHYFEMAK